MSLQQTEEQRPGPFVCNEDRAREQGEMKHQETQTEKLPEEVERDQ